MIPRVSRQGSSYGVYAVAKQRPAMSNDEASAQLCPKLILFLPYLYFRALGSPVGSAGGISGIIHSVFCLFPQIVVSPPKIPSHLPFSTDFPGSTHIPVLSLSPVLLAESLSSLSWSVPPLAISSSAASFHAYFILPTNHHMPVRSVASDPNA